MTWVIGANTPFGYGFIVSDVQITISGGTTIDCLQKVYPVGDFIAAGFAGSVELGFAAIQDLRRFLNDPAPEVGECWIPEWVAQEWSPRVQELFRRAPEAARRASLSILMVGAHPTEDGINGARTYTAILRSPEFKPRVWNNFDCVQSIGCGSGVEEYKLLLGSSFREKSNLMGEMMGPGGMAHVMIGSFMRRVFNSPTPGVSHHLQYVIVRRGGVEVRNYEPTRIQGEQEVTFKMPQLAHTWEQLQALIQRERGGAVTLEDAMAAQ